MSDTTTPADPSALTTYVVTLSAVEIRQKEVEIRAACPEEAARLVESREDGGDLRVVFVETGTEGYAVNGRCEACSAWLLEGRDEGRTVDEDGVMLCTPCCKGAEEDGESEPLPVDDPDATQVIPPPLLLDELDGTGPEATAPAGGEE